MLILSTARSTIIKDIQRISESGSAHMAYFFFDFKDAGKHDTRAFLSSVLVQLSSQSASLRNILLEFYSAHQRGSQQPSESALIQCLEKMLQVPKVPLYLIVDALDECPATSGMHSSREKVLELVEKLVGLHLPNLRLCITSRPEVDIQNVLEPLTSTSTRMSLHDEDGQKKDIADYISSVVYSDTKIMRWPEQDKELVNKTLSDRADGKYERRSSLIAASYVQIDFDGFRVKSRLYAAVSHQVCDVFLKNCQKPWTRRMNGYYRKFPGPTEYIYIDSCNA